MAEKNKGFLPTKWDPFMSEMASFKKLLDEKFENFFASHPFSMRMPLIWQGKLGIWKPEVDIYETNKEVVVEANVPGCDKKNVHIGVNNNILTISGEKKEESQIKKRNFYHKEQHLGSFRRSLSLPHYADTGNAKATCDKGVLKIVFPKTKSAQGRTKTIKIADNV